MSGKVDPGHSNAFWVDPVDAGAELLVVDALRQGDRMVDQHGDERLEQRGAAVPVPGQGHRLVGEMRKDVPACASR